MTIAELIAFINEEMSSLDSLMEQFKDDEELYNFYRGWKHGLDIVAKEIS